MKKLKQYIEDAINDGIELEDLNRWLYKNYPSVLQDYEEEKELKKEAIVYT